MPPSPPPPATPPSPPAAPPAPPQSPPSCGAVDLRPLLPLVDVTASASASAPALAPAAAASPAANTTALSFLSFVPGGGGSAGLSLGGVSLGASAAAAAASYTIDLAEATRLRAVLRTPRVFASASQGGDAPHARNVVKVAAQLSDAANHTHVRRDGLSLTLVLQGASGITSAACPAAAAQSGLATCSCEVPSGWFSSAAVGAATATVQMRYDGELRLEIDAEGGAVVLGRTPSHGALTASGMALAVPSSPRFGGDSFTAVATASLVGVSYGLMAWQVALSYNASLLSLTSYAVDAVWGDATATEEAGSLRLLMNAPADSDAANPDVTGLDIPILSATFAVAAGAAAGSHADALSLRVVSMLNFANNFIAEETDALVLDGRDGGRASATLEVEAAVEAALFAHFAGGVASLLNTAPLTGDAVSTAVAAFTVSTRPHAPDYTSAASVAACASTSTSGGGSGGSGVIELSGCTAAASSAMSAGGAVQISVTVEGLPAATLGLDVWYPSPLALLLDDAILDRFDGCAASGDGDGDGDGSYQSSRLRVTAGEPPNAVDVTPLLGTAGEAVARLSLPANGVVALDTASSPGGRVARLQVRGVAAGSGAIRLVHAPAVHANVTVTNATSVSVSSLFVGALTAADSELALRPAGGTLAPHASFAAEFGLRQALTAEGDDASLHGVATLSDGTVQQVPHAQLNLTVRTPSLEPPTRDAASEDDPWQVRVSTAAVRDCGPLLTAQWVAPCGGGGGDGGGGEVGGSGGGGAMLAETEVELFLQLPTPVAVRITTAAGLTLAPQGDPATLAGIGLPSSASFSAAVDFVDPMSGATSTRDFTADARTTFHTVESNAAACTATSASGGIVVSVLAAGCGDASSFGVYATVDLGSFGTLTSAPYAVSLATFSSLTLRLDASPAGTWTADGLATLRKLQCTETYQRAQPAATATLSTGATYVVTGQCAYASADASVVSVSGSGGAAVFAGVAAGSAELTATFGASSAAPASAAASLAVDASAAAEVASMALSLPSLLHGESGYSTSSTLSITLVDGTVYSDVHALGWLDATAVVAYSSDVPAAVAIDGAGGVTLLANHHSLVAIAAATRCAPTFTATASTAPNLAVPFRGVDLGANDGLQFVASADGVVSVPVVVNAVGVTLTSFQVSVEFEPALLLATGYTEGVGGGSGATASFDGPVVTLNSPVDEAKLLGHKDAAVAPTGLVQLLTLALQAQPGASGVTAITGTVHGLITCTVCDPASPDDVSDTDLGPISAGAGYVVLGGRRQRRGLDAQGLSSSALPPPQRRRLRPQPQQRSRARSSRALGHDGRCCFPHSDASGTYLTWYGDTNGDCVFDIKDVKRASDLLLLQPEGDTGVPTHYAPGGEELCAWQRAQLDPTLDGAFKQNDAVYLLMALATKCAGMPLASCSLRTLA